MEKKFQKLRRFNQEHPRITSAAAGLVVGGAVVVKLMYTPQQIHHLHLTEDQFNKLKEFPGSCMVYSGEGLRDILHVTIPQD